MMRESLYSAAVADAMDQIGLRQQSPRVPLQPLTGIHQLIGRCKTTLWIDFDYEDRNSYKGELKAVDSCCPDDVMICAGQGSIRAALWGDLLSLAAHNAGCVGAIVDGATRDILHWSLWHFQFLHVAHRFTMR